MSDASPSRTRSAVTSRMTRPMSDASPPRTRSAVTSRMTRASAQSRPATEQSPPKSRAATTDTMDTMATVSISSEAEDSRQADRKLQIMMEVKAKKAAQREVAQQLPQDGRMTLERTNTALTSSTDPRGRSEHNLDEDEVDEVSDFHSPSPRNGSSRSPSNSPSRPASTRIKPDLSLFAGCVDPTQFDQEEETEDSVPRGANRTNNYFHRPSSVARISENAEVAQFVAWADSKPQGWDKVRSLFMKDALLHHGPQPTPGLTKKKWVSLLMRSNYPNEAGLHTVWDEVAKEINTDKLEKGVHAVIRMENDTSLEAEITVPQFKRFERRVRSVSVVLSPVDTNSPAKRFMKWLRKKYGSTLLAWRLMLDVHSTGRVAYADFLNGCRSMGVGSQGRSVWSNLKKDKGHAMEFHELDPEEGVNLQEFAKVLWEKTELNMNKAWMQMDVMNQNYLTLEQFKTGCLAFGWRGDAQLLFRGLDMSGLGRLKQDDFRYICKGSHMGARRFMASQGPIAALAFWCKHDIGGTERLIELVGFYGKREIEVEELAQKLQDLGFDGNAMEAATKVAKQPQGSVVTAASLAKILKGSYYKPDEVGSPSQAFRSTSPSRSEHHFEWDTGVNDFALHNGRLCQCSRGYFGMEGRRPITRPAQVAQVYAPQTSSPRPVELEPHSPHRGGVRGPSRSDVSQQGLQRSITHPAQNSKYTADFSERSLRDLQRNRTGDSMPNSGHRSHASSKSARHLHPNSTREDIHRRKTTADLSSKSARDLQRNRHGDTVDKVPPHISKYAVDFSDRTRLKQGTATSRTSAMGGR